MFAEPMPSIHHPTRRRTRSHQFRSHRHANRQFQAATAQYPYIDEDQQLDSVAMSQQPDPPTSRSSAPSNRTRSHTNGYFNPEAVERSATQDRSVVRVVSHVHPILSPIGTLRSWAGQMRAHIVAQQRVEVHPNATPYLGAENRANGVSVHQALEQLMQKSIEIRRQQLEQNRPTANGSSGASAGEDFGAFQNLVWNNNSNENATSKTPKDLAGHSSGTSTNEGISNIFSLIVE